MRKLDRFLISHRPYAVKLDSLRTVGVGWAMVDALWFRRSGGVTSAHRGTLQHYLRKKGQQIAIPATTEEFLLMPLDGRYGGNCSATWDGARYWCSHLDPQRMAADMVLLKDMLEKYPSVPDGHDGWWEYDT